MSKADINNEVRSLKMMFHGLCAHPQERLATSRVGFIFMMYHASTWWYEIADLLRKLILTGLVTFVEKGSSTQVRVVRLI